MEYIPFTVNFRKIGSCYNGYCFSISIVDSIAVIFFSLGLLITFFVNLYKRRWKYSFKRLDRQLLSIATSIDASGNIICKDLFNLFSIKEKGYKLEELKETISSVLGKNQRDDTLRKTGKAIVFILGKIETNHCLINIDSLV